MKLHIAIDHRTGTATARGKSGRWYRHDEIERAYAARDRDDDPEGRTIADDLDRTDWNDADMRQAMLDDIAGCPECAAAMARGERPQIVVPSLRGRRTQRLRRWREQKKRR
jgi:hypothetical protein